MNFWSAISAALGLGPVKFVRRYTEKRQTPLGPATFSYEIFRADTAQIARDFLEKKNVTKGQHYVVVETPEGNWAKDIQGIYKEQLRDIQGKLVWKSSSASPERKGLTRHQMDLLWMDRTALTALKTWFRDPNSTVHFITPIGELDELKKSLKVSDIEWAEKVMAIAEQATAASQREDYAKAIQLYEQALEQAPDCDLYLMSIGGCFSNMGKPGEGLPYLEQALKISPSNTRIRTNLSVVLTSIGCSFSKMGKPREGLSYLERAAKINPNETRIRSALAAVRQMLRE